MICKFYFDETNKKFLETWLKSLNERVTENEKKQVIEQWTKLMDEKRKRLEIEGDIQIPYYLQVHVADEFLYSIPVYNNKFLVKLSELQRLVEEKAKCTTNNA
jgi:hypothetical protein